MYGYNAGQPMAIPINTVLPYCVIYTCICTCTTYIYIYMYMYIYMYIYASSIVSACI